MCMFVRSGDSTDTSDSMYVCVIEESTVCMFVHLFSGAGESAHCVCVFVCLSVTRKKY